MERSHLERELAGLHAEAWGWALTCCGRDRELAEDVLQSAYARIISGAETFRGDSSVKTWVFAIIRFGALAERRRRRRWRIRHEAGSAAVDVMDPAATADETTEQAERRDALLAAIATLAPRQREIIHLMLYHGMTIEQASEVMKVSVGSGRTHYDRAKRMLATKLSKLAERL